MVITIFVDPFIIELFSLNFRQILLLFLIKIVPVQEVQEEGKYAIDSPGNPAMADVPPEEYTLGINSFNCLKYCVVNNNLYYLISKRKMKNVLWWNLSLTPIPNYKS